MADRALTVRRLHDVKALWAAVTALLTSVELDMATLAIWEEVEGLITGMYSLVVGGVCLPAM